MIPKMASFMQLLRLNLPLTSTVSLDQVFEVNQYDNFIKTFYICIKNRKYVFSVVIKKKYLEKKEKLEKILKEVYRNSIRVHRGHQNLFWIPIVVSKFCNQYFIYIIYSSAVLFETKKVKNCMNSFA